MPAVPDKSLAGRLGLLIAALAVIVVMLEITVRVLGAGHPPLAIRHAVVGKIHKPGFEGEVFDEEAGRAVFIRFNREGFRGPDVPYRRTTGTRRIAVVGDSMVAAVQVDVQDTAVARLERLLQTSRPEHRWEVLNFGVAGSSTGQELVLYREIVRRYRSDLVVLVYFMGNDFSDNSRRLSNNPRIYFELDEDGELVQQPFSPTSKKGSAWLNENSRFYVWQKRAIKRLRHDLGTRSGYRIFEADPDAGLEAAWRLNAALLTAFRDAVEGDGARFLLVLCPAGGQIYDDMWELVVERAGSAASGYDREFARTQLASVAARGGIAVLDLTAGLRAARGRPLARAVAPEERLYLAGGEGHLSARGNREVAALIHRYLLDGDGREILAALPSMHR